MHQLNMTQEQSIVQWKIAFFPWHTKDWGMPHISKPSLTPEVGLSSTVTNAFFKEKSPTKIYEIL